MYPELLSIGNFTIYTYGVLVAAGFFAGMRYIVKKSRNIFSDQQIYDFLFYMLICSIIGARALYVLINFGYFVAKPIDIFKIWQGGLVYYGGFITALIFSVIYCNVKKINFFYLADFTAPAIALGHFFGRIGCFFSGCCYGAKTDCFLAVDGRYPTQLYEAAGNIIIFFILNSVLNKKHKHGSVFVLYLLIYSFFRFMIEFLRGDDRGKYIFSMSPAQNISIAVFIIGLIMLFLMYGAKNEK